MVNLPGYLAITVLLYRGNLTQPAVDMKMSTQGTIPPGSKCAVARELLSRCSPQYGRSRGVSHWSLSTGLTSAGHIPANSPGLSGHCCAKCTAICLLSSSR